MPIQWNLLHKLDQFGVTYLPVIKNSETKFKSSFGGLFSIILYCLSFCYLIYIIIFWQFGGILPKIIKRNIVDDYEIVNFQQSAVTFQIAKPFSYEPFEKQNNIITALIYYVEGDKFIGPYPFFTDKDDPIDPDGSKLLKNENFNLTINLNSILTKLENRLPNKQVLILLSKCDPSLLPSGGTCARQEIIDQFFNFPLNRLNLIINLEQFSIENKNFQKVSKPNYFIIEDITTLYVQIVFKIQKFTVNDGLLFNNLKYYRSVSNAELITQNIQANKINSILKGNSFMVFLFRLDSNQEDVFISFPSLGEVLAMAGSIIQALMLIKVIPQIFNSIQMEKSIIREIISIYFPEFKKVQINENFFGKLKSVRMNNNQYDLENFKKFYKKASITAKQKLSLLNQQYEISRIQMVLQSLQHRNLIQRAKRTGIKLRLKQIISHHREISNEQINLTDKIENLVQDRTDINQSQQQIPSRSSYFLSEEDFGIWNQNDQNESENTNCNQMARLIQINQQQFYIDNYIES